MSADNGDKLPYTVSQKFIHSTAVIVGVLFGSAAALAVPEILGVSSLPQAVETLQGYVARASAKNATQPAARTAAQPVAPVPVFPATQPAALPPVAAPADAKAGMPAPVAAIVSAPTAPVLPAKVVAPTPVATPRIESAPTAPAKVQPVEIAREMPAPVPKFELASAPAATPVKNTSIMLAPPETSSILAAPSLAPREIVTAAASRPGDALVASVVLLSPELAAPVTRELAFAEPLDPAEVPLPRARPDDIPGPSPADRLALAGPQRVKAERCLAEAVYFESRNQPVRGQAAVAQVVINRVFSPYYPNDVCGVVYQNAHRHLSCQFTFACDGIPERIYDRGAWGRAQRIAKQTLDGQLWLPEVAKSTHYHASYVRPYWVREMKTLARHGLHTFYRPWRWGDGRDEPSWGVASKKKTKSAGI